MRQDAAGRQLRGIHVSRIRSAMQKPSMNHKQFAELVHRASPKTRGFVTAAMIEDLAVERSVDHDPS